jgi:hypothetical protein
MGGCSHQPEIKEPGKRYAVEYFDYCPTFDILFKDEEVLVLISDTGPTVTFTSYEPHSVSFIKYYYIELIKEHLEKINKTIPEIDVVIHNHFNDSFFHYNDITFLNRLRLHEFRGMFAIYFVPLKLVMVYREVGDTQER